MNSACQGLCMSVVVCVGGRWENSSKQVHIEGTLLMVFGWANEKPVLNLCTPELPISPLMGQLLVYIYIYIYVYHSILCIMLDVKVYVCGGGKVKTQLYSMTSITSLPKILALGLRPRPAIVLLGNWMFESLVLHCCSHGCVTELEEVYVAKT